MIRGGHLRISQEERRPIAESAKTLTGLDLVTVNNANKIATRLCEVTLKTIEVGRFGISAPHISRACGGYQSILGPRNGMSERAVVRY